MIIYDLERPPALCDPTNNLGAVKRGQIMKMWVKVNQHTVLRYLYVDNDCK